MSLRIGIIGTGLITPFHHLALQALAAESPDAESLWELSFVASRRLSQAALWVDQYATPATEAIDFNNLADNLARLQPDLVIVASPNFLHFEHAQLALQQGAHVLIEKPMTVTLTAATQLNQLANQLQRQVFYAENHCFAPAILRLKEIIRQQQIKGHRLRRLTGYFAHSGPKPGEWQTLDNTKITGNGVLMDLGTHVLTTLADLLSTQTGSLPTTLSRLTWLAAQANWQNQLDFRWQGQLAYSVNPHQATVELEMTVSWQAMTEQSMPEATDTHPQQTDAPGCYYLVEFDHGKRYEAILNSADLVTGIKANQVWLPDTVVVPSVITDLADIGGYTQQLRTILQCIHANTEARLNGLIGELTLAKLLQAHSLL